MLLSARLYRSTARSFNAFNRLGDNSNTVFSTETKSRKELEAICIEEPPNFSNVAFPQLQVNTSNLKFRKNKSKKEIVQDVGCEIDKLEPEYQSDLKEGDKALTKSKLFLGESKSDFEQWLEGSHSIQTADTNDTKIHSCDEYSHQDSVISSCNASDCSEEDKDDKSTLVSEWSDDKFGKILEGMTENCKVHCCISRSNCSSGCHSMTASSSGIVSDTEGVGCKGPENPQQDLLRLQEELNLKMVDFPLMSQFMCEDDVFLKLFQPEPQFQVVQNKKKSKSRPSEKKNIGVDGLNHACNQLNNKTIDDSMKDKKRYHHVRSACSEDNFRQTVASSHSSASGSRASIDIIPCTSLTESSVIPENVPTSRSSVNVDIVGDAATRKVKKSQKNKKAGNDVALIISEKMAITSNPHHDILVSETKSSQSLPELDVADFLSNSNLSQESFISSRKLEIMHPSTSFGLGCKDMDIFNPSTSMEILPTKTEVSKNPSVMNLSGKQRFDLKQAQIFLLKAYHEVQSRELKVPGL